MHSQHFWAFKGIAIVLESVFSNAHSFLILGHLVWSYLCLKYGIFSLYFTAEISAEKRMKRIKEKTQKHLDYYARDGLRTLCIAKKVGGH